MSTNQSKCPIDITVGILSHKWASQIIRELFSGPKRPSQLYRSLKPISSKTLTQRLKMLQDQGIVDKVDKEGPAEAISSILRRLTPNTKPTVQQNNLN